MNSNITFLILLQQLTDIDFLFKASTCAIYLVNINSQSHAVRNRYRKPTSSQTQIKIEILSLIKYSSKWEKNNTLTSYYLKYVE